MSLTTPSRSFYQDVVLAADFAKKLHRIAAPAIKSSLRGKRRQTRKPQGVDPEPGKGRYPDMWNPRPMSLYSPKRRVTTSVPAVRDGNVGYGFEITNIPQGALLDQRERQQIHVKNIELMYYFRSNFPVQTTGLTAIDAALGRIVVLKLKQTDGNISTAQLADNFFRGAVANRTTDYSAVTDQLHKNAYPINKEKYRVLMDRTFKLGPHNGADGAQAWPKQLYRKVRIPVNAKVQYDNEFASGSQNGIYVFFFCGPAIDNVGNPQVSYYQGEVTAVINYQDIL